MVRADELHCTSTWKTRWSAATRPSKVALRRAIALAIDVPSARSASCARPGHPGAVAPWCRTPGGYDPAFKSENGDYDPARAKALLDLYGYVDRDGDGWREQPDGQPLVLEIATQPDQLSRQLDELWQKNMAAIGIRIEFKPASGPRT
jgi:ABC-type transport system substrate-binding protein